MLTLYPFLLLLEFFMICWVLSFKYHIIVCIFSFLFMLIFVFIMSVFMIKLLLILTLVIKNCSFFTIYKINNFLFFLLLFIFFLFLINCFVYSSFLSTNKCLKPLTKYRINILILFNTCNFNFLWLFYLQYNKKYYIIGVC